MTENPELKIIGINAYVFASGASASGFSVA